MMVLSKSYDKQHSTLHNDQFIMIKVWVLSALKILKYKLIMHILTITIHYPISFLRVSVKV